MNRISPRVAIALFLLMTSYGCSNAPTMSTAEEKFVTTSPWAQSVSEGAIKVRKFEKLDALTKEVDGVKHYSLSYDVELECVTPVFVIYKPDGTFDVFADDADNAAFKQRMNDNAKVLPGFRILELRPGDFMRDDGTLEFTLFEKGWK